MKHLLLLIFLLGSLHFSGFSQDGNPSLLTIPEDWKYEFIAFPLDFAPLLNYEGYEELRFAPGMFDVDSPSYFTYLFAISFEGKQDFSIPNCKKFLSIYYQGLCFDVAKAKEITVDTSKIIITAEKPKVKTGDNDAYFITVKYLDTFNEGNEVMLNMELVVLNPKSHEKTYFLALVSPQPKYSEIWKELYTYRKSLMSENPTLSAARGK